VNLRVKTKIRFNGRDYSSPSELPTEVRAAYEKAMADGAARKKIVINGEEFSNQSDAPEDVRKLCDDVMSVIENNGEVTLPGCRRSEPLVSKRQLQFILLVVGAVLSVVWLFVNR
jgi:hypothetical protein